MANPKVVVLDERQPVPTRSLWKLLNWLAVPADGRASPLGRDHDLARAYAAATTWLVGVERERGLPSFLENPDDLELGPEQAALGVCPFCHGNDGVLRVGEIAWGICRRHQTRWKCDRAFPEDSFSPDGEGRWEGDAVSAKGYSEVTPVKLSARAGAPAVSPVRSLAAKLISLSRR